MMKGRTYRRVPLPATASLLPAPALPVPASDPRPRSGPLVSVLGMLALVPVALALAVLLGAGVIRQGAPILVSVTAGALVMLPALGVAVAFRHKVLGFVLGLILWPTAVVVGFPVYFPGERAEALASGGSVLLLPLGMRLEADQAEMIDAFLPGVRSSRQPPPRAEVLPLEPVPPAAPAPVLAHASEDAVVLPYEGEGRSMMVQVGIEGPDGTALDRWFIFDTGATITTLDQRTLDELGVTVAPDAPELTVRTANGERTARVAMVERMWIGGMEVEGVTVSVCDECADEETVGLLGLNVAGRFRTTVDHARQELVLEPRDLDGNRAVDVAPWLDIQALATRWEDGRIEVNVRAENRGPRAVKRAGVGIHCDDTWLVELRDVPPDGEASTVVSLPLGADCEGYSVSLEQARW